MFNFWSLTGGRPMVRDTGYHSFTDVVTGNQVYVYKDKLGRTWLAEGRWDLFRVEKVTVDFTLNGSKRFVDHTGLSYDEIAEMVGYNPASNPSVVYRLAGDDCRDAGVLMPGQIVTVNDRTVINCIDTSNA